jgi:hypothetical protein
MNHAVVLRARLKHNTSPRRSYGQQPLDREHSATAVVDMGARDTSVTTCQAYSLGTTEWLRAVELAGKQVGIADPLSYYDHVEVR